MNDERISKIKNVLSVAHKQGERFLWIREIARRANISKSGVSRYIKELEEQGAVKTKTNLYGVKEVRLADI
ncbi:MAG: hypothetical protein A7316_02625 [Candidatus Altiarchaeales archaeon WOR_SM1_86-2]|nr:MAG: hypothetical protein A7316_02625 [Candidatus Altiarchaeales archaeon WOR_SM1_86-2]ODS39435.1 MAG: hypothetical protein A7315_11075 [Candidatus Altiarchaeales archaeon WOR_SM1_79]